MQPFAGGVMTKKLAAQHTRHADALNAEAERLATLHDHIKSARAAAPDACAAAARHAKSGERYAAAKAARGALDFDDLINRTLDLLGQPGIAPG